MEQDQKHNDLLRTIDFLVFIVTFVVALVSRRSIKIFNYP